jgi:mono/diheme cytochrome c family protein
LIKPSKRKASPGPDSKKGRWPTFSNISVLVRRIRNEELFPFFFFEFPKIYLLPSCGRGLRWGDIKFYPPPPSPSPSRGRGYPEKSGKAIENMKRIIFRYFTIPVFLLGVVILSLNASGAEKKEDYLLPGNVKEGWKAFTTKKCNLCHSILGEGGKGGPDLGTLPEFYVSQAQLAALMWNHGPEMWGRMAAKKIPFQKMERKEMADLFAFLYFIRYMDEPGDPQKGKALMEAKGCMKCHTVKEGAKGDLSRWGMYVNPILWAQMMWNHGPQMEAEMKTKGIPLVEFKGSEMVDLIAYIRTLSSKVEKVYLSPGDPQTGERLFARKGCVQCHPHGGNLDLTKKKDFPRTLAQLAGMMWNHSHKMWRGMKEKGIDLPSLSPQEMSDMTAYLFSTHYFDEPGNPERGKNVFIKKQCHTCHGKDAKMVSLANLKGRISPILMAQVMWNHGPEMLERMRKVRVTWQKIEGQEMVDLMEYLNRGVP